MTPELKKIRILFIIMMVFYILMSVIALGIFSRHGHFVEARLAVTDFMFSLNHPEVPKNTRPQVVGDITDTSDSPDYFPEQEPVVEPAQAEPVVEEVIEEPEPYEPEEPEPEPEPSVRYYSFQSINTSTILNMRQEPDIKAKSVCKLDPGTQGYVLELGDNWSKVYALGMTGYCSNEFISLTEISEDELPEEVKALLTSE